MVCLGLPHISLSVEPVFCLCRYLPHHKRLASCKPRRSHVSPFSFEPDCISSRWYHWAFFPSQLGVSLQTTFSRLRVASWIGLVTVLLSSPDTSALISSLTLAPTSSTLPAIGFQFLILSHCPLSIWSFQHLSLTASLSKHLFLACLSPWSIFPSPSYLSYSAYPHLWAFDPSFLSIGSWYPLGL